MTNLFKTTNLFWIVSVRFYEIALAMTKKAVDCHAEPLARLAMTVWDGSPRNSTPRLCARFHRFHAFALTITILFFGLPRFDIAESRNDEKGVDCFVVFANAHTPRNDDMLRFALPMTICCDFALAMTAWGDLSRNDGALRFHAYFAPRFHKIY